MGVSSLLPLNAEDDDTMNHHQEKATTAKKKLANEQSTLNDRNIQQQQQKQQQLQEQQKQQQQQQQQQIPSSDFLSDLSDPDDEIMIFLEPASTDPGFDAYLQQHNQNKKNLQQQQQNEDTAQAGNALTLGFLKPYTTFVEHQEQQPSDIDSSFCLSEISEPPEDHDIFEEPLFDERISSAIMEQKNQDAARLAKQVNVMFGIKGNTSKKKKQRARELAATKLQALARGHLLRSNACNKDSSLGGSGVHIVESRKVQQKEDTHSDASSQNTYDTQVRSKTLVTGIEVSPTATSGVENRKVQKQEDNYSDAPSGNICTSPVRSKTLITGTESSTTTTSLVKNRKTQQEEDTDSDASSQNTSNSRVRSKTLVTGMESATISDSNKKTCSVENRTSLQDNDTNSDDSSRSVAARTLVTGTGRAKTLTKGSIGAVAKISSKVMIEVILAILAIFMITVHGFQFQR